MVRVAVVVGPSGRSPRFWILPEFPLKALTALSRAATKREGMTMRKTTLSAAWLVILTAVPAFAQAGDPSFPKEVPPAQPAQPDSKKPQPDTKKPAPKPGDKTRPESPGEPGRAGAGLV